MFQIQRFTGAKPAAAKSSATVDNSSAVQSLLKRAEGRKKEQDEAKGKKRPITSDAKNSSESSHKKKKKVIIAPLRQETTEERDSRKASAKEDKRLRKDLVRGDESTGKILVRKSESLEGTFYSVGSVALPSQKEFDQGEDEVFLKDDEDNKDEEDGEDTEEKELKEPEVEDIGPAISKIKTFTEQLQPISSGRDESKKVLSQKKTDEDEDFTGEDSDEMPSEHPEPVTVEESLECWELDETIAKNLMEDGIDNFFPVQRMVIPQLLRNNARLCVQPRDMCVSAPTGSGKTIAYAVPIIQSLKGRSIVRLRAILLLPSRELAAQVYSVFCRLSRGTDLGIAVCTGQTPLEDEQRLIMGACYNGSKGGRHGHGVDADSLFSNRDLYFKQPSPLGVSAVDILICTPGRLLDHIQYTEGFTLQHLRFLVLDEADRLLGNAYHSWVRTLVQSAHNTESSSVGGLSATTQQQQQQQQISSDSSITASVLTLPFLVVPQQPLQRLLFSATLTDNPRKLAMLGIKNPLIIRATSSDVKVAAGSEGGVMDGEAMDDGGDGNGDEDKEVGVKGKNVKEGLVSAAAGGYMLPHTLEESISICETARRP